MKRNKKIEKTVDYFYLLKKKAGMHNIYARNESRVDRIQRDKKLTKTMRPEESKGELDESVNYGGRKRNSN